MGPMVSRPLARVEIKFVASAMLKEKSRESISRRDAIGDSVVARK